MIRLRGFTPTPESLMIYRWDEWLPGSGFRPPKERRNRKNKKATGFSLRSFTFIELIIIVVIISVLLVMAVPVLKGSLDSFELESFAKDVYYLCHYLQTSSITTGKIYYLAIDYSKGEFLGSYKDGDVFKNLEGKFARVFKAPDGALVEVVPSGKIGIYFYPDGSADEVTIDFSNKYNRDISVAVKGAKGEIKIQ